MVIQAKLDIELYLLNVKEVKLFNKQKKLNIFSNNKNCS